MTIDTLRLELQEEYKLLQGKWDDFDRRAQTIRGWFVAGAGAAIGFSGSLDPIFAPIALALAALNVWIVESVWKSWQHAYGNRIRAIEQHMRGRIELSSAFQIHHAWGEAYPVSDFKKVDWWKVCDEFVSRPLYVAYLPFILGCTAVSGFQIGLILPLR